jgi:molybdate transport system regulatory protein
LRIDGRLNFALPSAVPPRKTARAKPAKAPVLQYRLRVMHKGEIAMGPGKADLLAAIRAHGSISKGAKLLGMSYMRAWTLVRIMNRTFRAPLVEKERGGLTGGAARLTSLGLEVLKLYADLVDESRIACRKSWAALQKQLKK